MKPNVFLWTLLTLLGALCVLLLWGSTPLVAQALESGTTSSSAVVEPMPPEIARWGVRPITLADVERIEDGAASETTLARYEVPTEAARHFARGFIIERAALEGPLVECLYLPKLDTDGSVLGHFFLYSNDSSCRDFGALSATAAAIVARARTETGEGSSESAWQLRAHQLSAERFYSISVAGYLFRPPLVLSHNGLPLFLMVPAELPASCDPQPMPEAIVLAHDDTLFEAASYDCRGGAVLYSHYALREMSPDDALWPDLPTTLADWKTNVIHSGAFAEEGLERLNLRWFGRMRTAASGDSDSGGGAP